MPCSIAAFAAVSAAVCAANGVDFLEPLNPSSPELAHDTAFPCTSVIVTIVLLKVDCICAAPRSIFFLSRLLRTDVPFLATFCAAISESLLTFSC